MADSIGNDTEPYKVQGGDVWFRPGMALWIVLAVAVTVKTLVQGNHHSIYKVFAVASQHWWADLSLYDMYDGIDIYLYSPTFAVAFTPFAMLPSRLGSILWNLPSMFFFFGRCGSWCVTFCPVNGRRGEKDYSWVWRH